MKTIYISIIAALALPFSGFGQGNIGGTNNLLPSITRPSPTVAQLMKVEESSLDHYTGQPQIAVPLFSTKAGNLDVGLTLSYNSSGIRVNETSGWVGKGWSLETGGVISRSVVDLPDEIDTDNHKGANVSGLYTFFEAPDVSETRRQFAYDAQWGTQVDLDSKTDIYQFSFFGRTGRFVFIKSGNTLQPSIIGNDGDYKIEPVYTNNPLPNMYPKEITSFVITDDTGNRYYFDQIERTEKKDVTFVYTQEGCDDPVAPSDPLNIGKFISAWHLSRVEDANGIRLLDISYADRLEKPKAPISSTEYIGSNLQYVFTTAHPGCTQSMKCALKPRKITNQPFRDIQTKKISRISFPDGSSIRFHLSASHPEYIDGKGTYLTKIEVYNAQEAAAVRTFDFGYAGDGIGASANALFLDKVKINGSDTDRYAFDYYKREIYPGFGTDNRDSFGYASFEPSYDAARTGVLSKISYPTKGVREFEWEPNTYSYRGDRLLTFVEIFNNPDNYTTDPANINDSFINSATTRPYTIIQVNSEQDAFVYSSTSYSGTEAFDMANSIHIVPIVSVTDQTVDTTRPDAGYPIGTNETIHRFIRLKQGAYKVYFGSLNQTVSNTERISGSIDIMIKKPTRHLNWFLYGGGLRIKDIRDKDRNINQMAKGFAYNFENPGITLTDLPFYPYPGGGSFTLAFSSGSLDGSENLVREYVVNIAPIYNIPGQLDNPIEYLVREQQSELDAQLQKGSFIGYKNVFEYAYPNVFAPGAPIFKSKIRYVFDSPIDFPSDVNTYYPPMPIRGDEYKQSNVRKIEYFGSGGVGLVATEDFRYNYDDGSIKIPVKKNLHFLTNENNMSGFCQQVRTLYTSYQRLKNNTISAFQYAISCTGAPSPLAQAFHDEDKSICTSQLTLGFMFIEDYRYKSQVTERIKKEYFPSGIVETRENFSYKNGYKRLDTQATLNSSGELLETRYLYADDSQMPAATTPYKAELIARHMTGIQLRTETYRNGLPVAAQETRYGMFTLPADPSNPAPPAVGNTLLPQYIYAKKGDNPFEKKLTFDSYDSRANITQYTQDGGVPVSFVWGYRKSLPVAKIENMAYAAIPPGLIAAVQNYSDTIMPHNELSLLSSLEDLRITATAFGAMMTGYSYKPLVGISATLDPKGERTYYQYDTFGRLITVRDHNMDLISQNKYHYRTQN